MTQEEQKAQVPALPLVPTDKVPVIAEAIRKRTSMPAYRLRIEAGRKPGLTDTKFGGLPYWPADLGYPATPKGQKLMLLAQLNLADFGDDERLPGKGLLQFFIDAEDDCSGMDFDDSTRQNGFRVIWHKVVDPAVTPEQVEAIGMPTSLMGFDEDYLGNVLAGEFALRIEPTTSTMNTADGRIDELFVACCREIMGDDFVAGRDSYWDLLDNDGVSLLFDELKTPEPAHFVFGHPFFTQSDPRYGELADEFDTLLLQVDSEGDPDTKKDRILWGDVGIGGFFINGEALSRGDFSRVLFNWDCY
ncbi:MAG: DUF1963 domain-containing protein [Atopobiaceae bacterium]|nr:DUF1963 domain-containing protein [Atopobiaceae bacterium]